MNSKKYLEFVHVELKKDTWADPLIRVTTQNEAIVAAGDLIRRLDREMVILLNLTINGRVINASVVSIGNISASFLNPPEILRTVLLSGAESFIILHNHPSGETRPSKEDQNATKRIASAAKLMGLTLTDFIIVGEGSYYSMLESDQERLEPTYLVAEECN